MITSSFKLNSFEDTITNSRIDPKALSIYEKSSFSEPRTEKGVYLVTPEAEVGWAFFYG